MVVGPQFLNYSQIELLIYSYLIMIEINTLNSQGYEGEFYKLRFQRLGFLFFPKPDLSALKHFSKSQQRELGKMKVRFNMTSLIKYANFFKDVNYVLVTDFEEILLLPFLCRLVPNVVIIATSLAYQLARISLEAFQERVAEFDATHQKMDFFKESRILDEYELQINANLEEWKQLYSKEEVLATLKRIVKVNYHQVYDTERGVLLRSFPSGKNNGACFYELQAVLTYQKILMINQLSQYNWRTCQPYKFDKIRQSFNENPFNIVIFTRRTFQSYVEGEEQRIAETIRRINSNAAVGISTTIVLEDETVCIDLIPRLEVQPEGRIRQILLGSQYLHSLHNYVNSYADYLSDHYKGQLFSQTPDYPLIQYSKLREKGFLLVGSLQELAIQKKLPLKEIILQSHPFVRFVKDYEHFLEIDGASEIAGLVKHTIEKINLASNFNGLLLQTLKRGLGKARFLGFCEGIEGIESLQLGKRYNLDGEKPNIFLMANDFRNKTFQYFELIHNEVEVKQIKLQLVKIPKNWITQLVVTLSSKGIPIQHQDKSSLKTGSSTIELTAEGRIALRSTSASELFAIAQVLQRMTTKYDLP